MRPPLWIRLLAGLVPESARDAWRREWTAEREHARRSGQSSIRVALSALEDAAGLLPARLASVAWTHDLRFVVRSLRSHRAFAIASVLTIAIGVGANAAIFSVVDAYLLEPLPIAEPERVFGLLKSNGDRLNLTSAPNYLDLRESTRSFDRVAAVHLWASNLAGGEAPQRVSRARVTAEFFDVLGVAPLAGRFFLEAETVPGNDAVVVVSHELWAEMFASDPGALGRSVRIDGVPHVIVGVLPPGFRAPPFTSDIYVPLAFLPDALESRGRNNLHVVGRLAARVTVERAQREVADIGARLAADHPLPNEGWSIRAIPLRELALGETSVALWKLLAAVGLVLLISCVNVANLVIARGMARERELAVRVSLGASRARLLRLLLLETICIALAGGVIGMVLALLAVDSIRVLIPATLSDFGTVELNGRVLAFGMVASILAGVGAGIVPAFRLSAGARHSPAHGAVASKLRVRGGTDRVRTALAVVQFALATVLLIAAGLVARSLARISAVDVGVRTDATTVFGVTFPEAEYATPDRVIQAVDDVIERLRSVPGVTAAAATSHLPLTGSRLTSSLRYEGGPEVMSVNTPSSSLRVVTAEYFDVFGVRLVAGRMFGSSDDGRGEPVALVNQTLARTLWPDGDALGKWIAYAPDAAGGHLRRRIVGIIADVRHAGPMSDAGPEVYEIHRQTTEIWRWFGRSMTFAARTSSGAMVPIDQVRDAVAAVDPGLPVTAHTTLDVVLGQSVASPRFNGVLLGSCAGLSLLLASIGLYGVLAFSVRQRRREVGVRLALGALRGSVLRIVLLHAFRLVAIGSVIGVISAIALNRTIETFVWGVRATDPLTYAVVIITLSAVAFLAALVPAWRAASVDPAISLRDD